MATVTARTDTERRDRYRNLQASWSWDTKPSGSEPSIYPKMLPMPVKRPAHALAIDCCSEGHTSTIRARTPDCKGWIEMFRRMIHVMVPYCVVILILSCEWMPNTFDKVRTSLLIQANAVRDMIIPTAPPRMKGRLRPQRRRELSAIAPTRG